MPISDDALQKEKNRFIAVKGDAKFGQAIAALTSFDGQPWWHLVVQLNDGSWRAARFSQIVAAMAANRNAAETTLTDVHALQLVPVVERRSIETKAAQALARKNPARILVITENGVPIGILVEGTTRAAVPASGLVVPTASLEQLGGKYVRLKDYGSILLGSSKKQERAENA